MAEYELSTDIQQQIFALDDELHKLCGFGVSTTYRCDKCWRYSTDHRQQSVQDCNFKKLDGTNFCDEIKLQREQLQKAIEGLTIGKNLGAENVSLRRDLETKTKEFEWASQYTKAAENKVEELTKMMTTLKTQIELMADFLQKYRAFRLGNMATDELHEAFDALPGQLEAVEGATTHPEADDRADSERPSQPQWDHSTTPFAMRRARVERLLSDPASEST